MENENDLGTSGEPSIESANQKILNKENLEASDIKAYLEAQCAFTEKFMQDTKNEGVTFFLRFTHEGEKSAIDEWEKSRAAALEVLLCEIYFNRKTGVETTPKAAAKCIALLINEPVIVNRDVTSYKKTIRSAEVWTERARGKELFPVQRALVAALEFNAEKFTLLYGRANRSTRLKVREERFKNLLGAISK